MNTIQLFCGLLMLMTGTLLALGVALHRLSASRERASLADVCTRCSLALEPMWRHCPLCGHAVERAEPAPEQLSYPSVPRTAVTGTGHGG
jgi:hypothetical protein